MASAKTALIVSIAVGLVSAATVCAAPAAPSGSAAPTKSNAKTKSKATTTQTGIAIQGRSAFFGPYSMQVGRGLKIRAKFGFTIWSLDKPNDVNMLNAENKVFYRDTYQGWLTWNRRGAPTINITEVTVIDKPTISGQPCVHYYGYQMVGSTKVCVAEFTCLQKAPCDQKVLEFWCKHFLIPPKYGFPIRVKQRSGNQFEIVLETNNVRTIPIATDAFQVPKNYLETKDKAVMYFGGNSGGISQSDLESIFQQPLK